MDNDNIDGHGPASDPVTAGSRLRFARESAGLSLADIASQTKIAERHLVAIEEDRFGDLAARTYAVGFARAYARVLGLDEGEIAGAVHSQIDSAEVDRGEPMASFEPGDPARVPPVRLAWIAAGAAVVVIALLLTFWSSFLSPEGKLPDLTVEQTQAPATGAVAPSPALQPTDGPVVLTAEDGDVWLRVTDVTGKKLLEKVLVKGESWTVPADAKGPQLRTGRPDELQVTIGGKAIPPLSTRQGTVSGVSLTAADLLARSNPPVSTQVPSQAPAARPAATPSPVAQAAPQRAPAPLPTTKPTAHSTPKPLETPKPKPSMTAQPVVEETSEATPPTRLTPISTQTVPAATSTALPQSSRPSASLSTDSE